MRNNYVVKVAFVDLYVHGAGSLKRKNSVYNTASVDPVRLQQHWLDYYWTEKLLTYQQRSRQYHNGTIVSPI
jgi:hypothetical protein